ncbi:MAG: septal ring lytic transglycosylase RlpA family protein [Candidatus Obscuribacter sp.]|nr:septal ring lytic transglycosylase RlpA family protein [Candidatus Obscuribacter sp.]
MTVKLFLPLSLTLVTLVSAAHSRALANENGHGQLLAGKSKSKNTASYPKNFSGNASWYGIPFHGRKTASGETFDMNKLTAAHLKLPFHTKVLVEDPKTGKSIVIKVNDRGPYAHGRVMDLAKEAAKRLGTLPKGVAYIDCTVIDDDDDDDAG